MVKHRIIIAKEISYVLNAKDERGVLTNFPKKRIERARLYMAHLSAWSHKKSLATPTKTPALTSSSPTAAATQREHPRLFCLVLAEGFRRCM